MPNPWMDMSPQSQEDTIMEARKLLLEIEALEVKLEQKKLEAEKKLGAMQQAPVMVMMPGGM